MYNHVSIYLISFHVMQHCNCSYSVQMGKRKWSMGMNSSIC